MNPNTLKKEYLVQVQTIEARQIRGKDASGTSDAFVKITVADQPPQITRTALRTNFAIWNQSFTFSNIFLSDVDLENFEITIELFDRNDFLANSLIGAYSIGLATLYRSRNHEFFQTWLALLHPQFKSEPQAFILVSAYIIGSDDNPPVHAINEIMIDENKQDDDDDGVTLEQLRDKREKGEKPAVLDNPMMNTRNYQLNINIAKFEDLLAISGSSCNPFVSVRCVGHNMVTQVIENSQKPVFNTRMQFPVSFPVMHDKIVMRVWDKGRVLADTFIARVPERIEDNDYFNINSLQSRGGTMAFRWINLYGIPGDERKSAISKIFNSKPTLIEGTEYMGRALISMTLTPSEKPERGVFPLPTFREPNSQEYTLRVDVYELQEAKDCGETVKVLATIGKQKAWTEAGNKRLNKGDGKNASESKSYQWRNKKVQIEDIKATFPVDLPQVPDIILSVHTTTLFSEKRVSYIRIPATDPKIADDQAPQWYTLKSVNNNVENTEHGYLLANVVLKPTSTTKASRIPKRRDITMHYLMLAYVYGGYDLAPELHSSDVIPDLKIKIAPEKPFGPKTASGKYPVWDKIIPKIVTLDENLEFASKIVVTVTNEKKSMFSGMQDNTIGTFTMSALDCVEITKFEEYEFNRGKFIPKFYHLMKDGFSKGRILASFVLMKCAGKNIENPVEEEAKYDKRLNAHRYKLDTFVTKIDVSLLGIRNLAAELKRPRGRISIAQKGDPKVQDITIKEEDQRNINILDVVTFPDVELTKDPRFLPVVEMLIWDEGSNKKYFTSTPLFEYASQWQKAQVLQGIQQYYYAGPYNTNHKDTIEKHEADKGSGTDLKMKKVNSEATSALTATNLVNFDDREKNSAMRPGDRSADILANFVKGTAEKEIYSSKKDLNAEEKTPYMDRSPNKKTVIVNPKKLENEKAAETAYTALINTEETEDSSKVPNVRFDHIFSFECTKQDKNKEENERQKELSQLKAAIKESKSNPQVTADEVGLLIQKATEIRNQKVEEKDFLGDDGRVGEEYDYGRPVQKEPMEEVLSLPYLRYELYEMVTFGKSFTTDKNGFVKSGIKSGAILKGAIQIEPPDDIDTKSKSSKTSKMSKASNYLALGQKKADKDSEFRFDIFDPSFLKYFNNKLAFKVRVYLLRGLNLSAQEDATELRDRLAGMDALSSANSYPIIIVGNGQNMGFDVLKQINDKANVVPQNLNPNYFKPYELDISLPQDWKLEIHIQDHKSMWRDTLIGSTMIDLEDRLIGELSSKQSITYEVLRDKFEQELKELEQGEEGPNIETLKDDLRAKIGKVTSRMESINRGQQGVVEYRALRNPAKNTSQGTIEMFIEVLPLDIARSMPLIKIEPPKPQDFEMRLIIYECFNVPLDDSGNVDIFVRANLLSSEGWTGEDLIKDTDTHYGSSDGHGIFNYRMKFPLKVPSSFPRIKLAVYDANVFGSDESIGSRVISLKQNIKKLMSEGKYISPPGKIDLFHPNYPNQTRGQILMSLNIIPLLEAEARPVGEAQEDPNRDPYLERPTEGRDIADFFKGTILGKFNLFGFFSGRILKWAIGIIILLVLIVILFIKPGVLIK